MTEIERLEARLHNLEVLVAGLSLIMEDILPRHASESVDKLYRDYWDLNVTLDGFASTSGFRGDTS